MQSCKCDRKHTELKPAYNDNGEVHRGKPVYTRREATVVMILDRDGLRQSSDRKWFSVSSNSRLLPLLYLSR